MGSRGAERAKADAELRLLARHFQRQAYLTLYALAPVSLVVVPFEALTGGSDNFLSVLDEELLLALSPRHLAKRLAAFGELVPAVADRNRLDRISDTIIEQQMRAMRKDSR